MTDPLALLRSEQERALRAGEPWEATAGALSTVDTDFPDVRFVLFKEIDEEGLWFYTNYKSPKAAQIDENPNVSVVFLWNSTHTQFRIRGQARRAPPARSDAYFRARPRQSQAGAWASEQSQIIPDRVFLETRVAEIEKRFAGTEIPRPPHWGGYCINPSRIEHWTEGQARLHDRIRYDRSGAVWTTNRLSP